jgi:hypothetical protein
VVTQPSLTSPHSPVTISEPPNPPFFPTLPVYNPSMANEFIDTSAAFRMTSRHKRLSTKPHYPHDLDPFLPLKQRPSGAKVSTIIPKSKIDCPLPNRVHLPQQSSAIATVANSTFRNSCFAEVAEEIDKAFLGNAPSPSTAAFSQRLSPLIASERDTRTIASGKTFLLDKYNSPPARKRRNPYRQENQSTLPKLSINPLQESTQPPGSADECHTTTSAA